jgi:hypothetical protein
MDHKEQHHQQHRKEREEKKKERKEHEKEQEKNLLPFHHIWIFVAGALLALVALLIWTFFFW